MSIKINKARAIAATGKFPRTFDGVCNAVPLLVVQAITAKQLAALIDSMRAQFEQGYSAGYKDAS